MSETASSRETPSAFASIGAVASMNSSIVMPLAVKSPWS